MISRPLAELIDHGQQLLKAIIQHPDYQKLVAQGYEADLTIGDAQTSLTYLCWAIESPLTVPEAGDIIPDHEAIALDSPK
jgi:hypothetical protein